MSFIVTGLGRSGTTWLAAQLAKGDHIVGHEGKKDASRGPHDLVRAYNERRRGRHAYGEVNSYLRHCLHLVDTDVAALLIRHPDSLWASAYRWRKKRGDVDLKKLNKDVQDGLWIIARFHGYGVPVFRIEDLSADKDEVCRMADYLGVCVNKDQIKLDAMNTSTHCEVPPVGDQFEWFANKFYSATSPRAASGS
jgi:hypothetical protein